MRYIVQLDALRGVAILFVLCNHTLPHDHLLFKFSERVSGPDVFFTLSGFLITALLLKDRRAVAQQRITTAGVFKNFFLKRALRLYPAYFLVLAADRVLTGNSTFSYVPYLTFTSNWVIAAQQAWGPLPPLWTLAVEQQFYLFWPVVVLLLPKKWVPYAITLCVGVGLYSQYVLPLPPIGLSHVLPHACLDALGLGALLAWVVVEKPQHFALVYRVLGGLALVSGLLMLGLSLWEWPFILQQRTLTALVVVWLIGYFVARGDQPGGVVNAVFTYKPLLLIGQISYGLYLYHTTVLSTAWPWFERLHRHLPFYQSIAYSNPLLLAESLVLLFALAWCSWKFLERPLTGLSKHLVRKKTPVGLDSSPPALIETLGEATPSTLHPVRS
ncbi:acyltransferase family protein [Hymenobacter arizonensis]|uniref:Peptidoglycan/LPS O-acetylase OafA/YrhL, contains acyltransferase and SGNH-hydrolase domains n=1 Tax=Hymenobacter arizonensis TaxID=1227077 RepID=A0A1I5T4C0_HYMAR|nr:acyltransferase [Hymenobacter arizonensis]SFP77507.1 Peptidoglycan/LPS O-acetylase OafA/YrhL, contains acyltransferase and SGNH-hydrolase domains [Hymenobacter arizonensis]